MNTIITSGREYALYNFRGRVAGQPQKTTHTHVSGHGGGTNGNSSFQVSSYVSVHDDLLLQSETGKERAFQLQGFDLACRAGNNMTIVWAVKKGQETGHYVMARNEDTDQSYFSDGSLNTVCRYSRRETAIRIGRIFAIIGFLAGIYAGMGSALKGALISGAFGGLIGAVVTRTNKKEVRRWKAELNAAQWN